MLSRIILFIFGLILSSSALCFIILYLNLINMGYTFSNYVNFIIKRFECWNLIIGILFIIISTIKRKEPKYDIYL